LVAGVGVGAAYGYSGYLLHHNRDYGIEGALGASALLAGSMLPRAVRTRRLLPVTLSVLALSAGGYYSKKYYDFN